VYVYSTLRPRHTPDPMCPTSLYARQDISSCITIIPAHTAYLYYTSLNFETLSPSMKSIILCGFLLAAAKAGPILSPSNDEPPIIPHIGPQCSGILGTPCPEGLECIDDPRDICDPNDHWDDCIGVCIGGGTFPFFLEAKKASAHSTVRSREGEEDMAQLGCR